MGDAIPGPLTEDELEAVLGHVDDPPTDVRYRKRRTGARYVAKGDGADVVVDLAADDSRSLAERVKGLVVGDTGPSVAGAPTVSRVLDLLAERTDVPAPEVLHHEPEPSDVATPYLVTRRSTGDSYDDDAMNRLDDEAGVVEELLSEAGRTLAEIHDAGTFDAFGDVRATDDGLAATDGDDWVEYLRGDAGAKLSRMEGERFSDLVPALRRYVTDATDRLSGDFEARLDVKLRLGSLRLRTDGDGSVIANVGGWETVRAVDPTYGLVEAEESLVNRRFADDDRRHELRERLYEGYERVRPGLRDGDFERRADLYRLTSRLYAMAALPYWLDSAPDAVVESRASRHREFVESFLDDAD